MCAHGFGKNRILRQKTIARMDRIGPTDIGCRNHRRQTQIGLGGLCGANTDAFIGKTHMQGMAVGLGIDRDRSDA
jgi:hypothetical protein